MYAGHEHDQEHDRDSHTGTLFTLSSSASMTSPPPPAHSEHAQSVDDHAQGAASGSNSAGDTAVGGIGISTPLPPPPTRSPPPPPSHDSHDHIPAQQQQHVQSPSQLRSQEATQSQGTVRQLDQATQHPSPQMTQLPEAPPAIIFRDHNRDREQQRSLFTNTNNNANAPRPFSIRRSLPPAATPNAPASAPRPHSGSSNSMEKEPLDDLPTSASGRELNLGLNVPQTGRRMTTGDPGLDGRPISGMGSLVRPGVSRRGTGLDWIVPETGPKTVEQRIRPTIDHAKEERDKCTAKARMTGFALNIAIGLQVVISALITGLSAVTTGKRTSIMTSVLGGFGTVVASYLARARGSNEPELSTARAKDLEKFIRVCEAFVEDHGYDHGHTFDERIDRLRNEFEQLLGNGDSQRKLAPPV